MRMITFLVAIVASALPGFSLSAQAANEPVLIDPLVIGEGIGRFQVGAQMFTDDFDNLEKWVVQTQELEGFEAAKVEAKNQTLDCFVPGRGCTVWFKQKLKTRVAITYDVICPLQETAVRGVEPSDINSFWMATDPDGTESGLFDSTRFNGRFRSYHKMHGYYASTGGGRNTTTRMRRYPREAGGKPVEHLALTQRDGKADFLITPGKLMRIQLVAYDDVIQYIVDGKLVYEIMDGAAVQFEVRDGDDQKVFREAVYDSEKLAVYDEGYFGFRMVGTHHVYSNFRVHELEPVRADLEDSSKNGEGAIMKPGE